MKNLRPKLKCCSGCSAVPLLAPSPQNTANIDMICDMFALKQNYVNLSKRKNVDCHYSHRTLSRTGLVTQTDDTV